MIKLPWEKAREPREVERIKREKGNWEVMDIEVW